MQIADAHNDLFMTFNSSAEVSRYLNFCKHNKVVKLFTAYYFSQEQKKQEKSMVFDDIEHKFSLLNDSNLVVKSFENIEFVDDFKSLQKFVKFKPFCATLTWNYENKLAGGALSKKKLSKWGKKVVTELNKNNILVDVAHLNEQSFWDISELQKELFCSHTASSEVYSIKRNLNAAQLTEIGKRDGYVGLCLYNTLLGGSFADFELIRRHLDNFLEYAGEDCVGLGTDFNGTGEQNPNGISMDYLGMQDLWNYLAKFYTENVLNKVFSQNLLNFEKRIKNGTNKSQELILNNLQNKKEQQSAVLQSPIIKKAYLAGEQRFEL